MGYSDTTYCTPEDIKKITAIVSSVNEKHIEPFLMSSQEMHIEPVLGTALDTELINQLEAGTLSGSNETLVTNFIVPACAWYAFYDSVPFLSIKAFNKGLVKQSSDSSEAISRDELKDYRQAVKEKAVFYRNRLIEFLKDNSTTYPKWRINDNDQDSNTRNYDKGFSGGIYLGKKSDKYSDDDWLNNRKYW